MTKTLRVLAILAAYFSTFIASMFLTMTILIKGEEVSTPDFVGKNLQESRQIALKKSLHLSETIGDFGSTYMPHTVVNQVPPPGTSIKEKSTVKVFVTGEVAQVEVPDIRNMNVRDAEKALQGKKLKRGRVSFISIKDVPIDTVVSQSPPPESMVNENHEVDILVSQGVNSISFIMPDLIGMEAAKVVAFFESKGLRITSIEEKSYYGLKPGIILRQSPDPGFEINSWNKIGIQVSK